MKFQIIQSGILTNPTPFLITEFYIGEEIAVNGSKEPLTEVCIDCGCAISRRAKRCKLCNDKFQMKDDCLLTTARQRKECQDKKKTHCEICDISNIRLVIHHKDENPRNNVENNLQTLCEKCHRKLHANKYTFADPYSHKYISYDIITSIEFVGKEIVYDIEMNAPNHNFVANGFI